MTNESEVINARAGFTMVEVVVATTVMAVMMIALLQYVSFAGMVWQRTHQAVSLSAEGNALLDTIERELSQASVINSPLPGAATTDVIQFTRKVSDFQTTATTGDATFKIAFDSSDGEVETALDLAPTGWASNTAGGAKVMDTDLYNYPLARNVVDFDVTRASTNLIDFYVKLESERNIDEATRTVELKRSILLTAF